MIPSYQTANRDVNLHHPESHLTVDASGRLDDAIIGAMHSLNP